MSREFEHDRDSEIVVADLNPAVLGKSAPWADALTNELTFSVSTLTLMEGLQELHPELEVREEQLECLDAIQEARVGGQKRALVQMATGLGKTTVVAADIKRFLADRPDARVLFLCHQNDILTQARERFENILGADYTYGNFTGESQDYHEVTCLFASLQAMRNWRYAFLETEFDYVVVDESHHGKAETYEPTLQYFQPEFMLGVTATPDRHDLKNIREIFGEEIYRLSLEEAIARDLLASVDYDVITDEIIETQILKDLRGKRLNLRQLDRTIFIPKRDEEIVRIIHEKAGEIDSPKRIVFCKSIEQAEEYAQYFDRAAPLHSGIPKWQQDRYIAMFRNGELDTLLTIDMFNEGIDIPDANQVVFLRSTKSKTVFLQQLGRGLRRAPNKNLVQVLDFVANCDRLIMLDQVWSDIMHYTNELDPSLSLQAMRIDIGEVHFSEAAREILDILAELESANSIYSNWQAEDSVAYYHKLCDDLGRIASVRDINEAQQDRKGPSYRTLTNPFRRSLVELQKACGIKPEGYMTRKDNKEWTAERSIEYYQAFCSRLGRLATVKDIEEAHRDGEGPSHRVLTQKHFEHKLQVLRKAAGLLPEIEPEQEVGEVLAASLSPTEKPIETPYEASIQIYLHFAKINGRPLTAIKFDQLLKQAGSEFPSLTKVLEPFDGKLSNLRATVEALPEYTELNLGVATRKSPHNGNQKVKWTAEDSVRIYQELSGDVPLRLNELILKLQEEHPELPSIRVILTPFGGKIPGLVKAAGYEAYRKEKPSNDSSWTAEDSIRVYRQLSVEVPLKARDLIKILRDRPDLPAFSVIIRPFNNRVKELRKAAGYEVGERKTR